MKKNYILGIMGFLLLSNPTNVNALTGSASLTCAKAKLSAGESTTCTIKGTASGGNVSSLSAQINLSSNLELSSVSTSSSWQGNGEGGNIQLYTDNVKTGNFDIGNFTVKVKTGVTNTNESVSVGSIVYYDDDTFAGHNISKVTKNIRVPSVINTLSKLSASGISFTFDKNVTSYNLVTDNASVNISAEKEDTLSSISGDVGSKSLNYGNNTFQIKVTSESGIVKTYTLNIKRNDNRSTNNKLKTLSLSSGSISFKDNITSYQVEVESDISSVTVSAELADSKASFVNGYGPRNVSLNYGSNNIIIKVKAENETEKSYTINVVRKKAVVNNNNNGAGNTNQNTNNSTIIDKNDTTNVNKNPKPDKETVVSKNTENRLKRLYLSSGFLYFKPDVTEYQIEVPYTVDSLSIFAEALSKKSTIIGTGIKNLEVGNNKFEVKVTSEDSQVRIYTIEVVRKEQTNEILDGNSNLKSLVVKDYEIDFVAEQLNYEIYWNGEKSLIIDAIPESEKANVQILGNENLKSGDEITIHIAAEDGNTKIYKIILIEKENNNLLYVGIGVFVVGLLSVVTAGLYIKKHRVEVI